MYLRYVAGASKYECQGSDRLWHHAEGDLIAAVSQCLASHARVPVVVGRSYVLWTEWRRMRGEICNILRLALHETNATLMQHKTSVSDN